MANLGKNILETMLPLFPGVSKKDIEEGGKYEAVAAGIDDIVNCYIAELKTDMQYELSMAMQYGMGVDSSDDGGNIGGDDISGNTSATNNSEKSSDSEIVIPDFTPTIGIGGFKNCGEVNKYKF